MEQLPDPNFLCLATNEGIDKWILVNLSLVRMVNNIKDGEISLHFSERHTVTIHGNSANELFHVLIQRAITTNGSPLKPYIDEAAKSQSQE